MRALSVADQDEAPRPQPSVIGRAQAGIEDEIEIGAIGRRLHERARRLAVQQKVQGGRRGDRTVEGMVHFLIMGTMLSVASHYHLHICQLSPSVRRRW